MESAVNPIIHSDPWPNRIPKTGEMVRVEGQKGLFVVKRVDRRHKTAEVIQRAWKQEMVELRVPLILIRTVPPQASKAIQLFLGKKPNGPGRSRVSIAASVAARTLN